MVHHAIIWLFEASNISFMQDKGLLGSLGILVT